MTTYSTQGGAGYGTRDQGHMCARVRAFPSPDLVRAWGWRLVVASSSSALLGLWDWRSSGGCWAQEMHRGGAYPQGGAGTLNPGA